ncbi:hypothetical protein [Paenibacillus sp. Leaf72]|uniref:hypothetical protein n=1 Tax=Paenibacillus sp. Leaf72 TaxID=1736234 RepID=UPI0006FAC2F5|nr:hypothetical protein [Paenibacillus sp. Leaf72]KQN96873.1 hypothetical protein ASF12_22655 [Paenibacillus sp. Leaf72]
MSTSFDLSPFHMDNKYVITWGKQFNGNKLNFHSLNTNQTKVVEKLCVLQFASKVQLAKILNPGNLRKGKKNVDFLTDKGFLIAHSMTGRENGKFVPFYGLSNPAREHFGLPRFEKVYTIEVLKRLLVFQFYTRFNEIDPTTTVEVFPAPFDACFTIMEQPFRIVALREKTQRDKVYNHIRFMEEQMRTLIVVPDWEDGNKFLDIKDQAHLFRVTTDHNLLKETLSNSFCKIENGEWVPEYIQPFEKQEKVEHEELTLHATE